MEKNNVVLGSQKMNLYYPRPKLIKSEYSLHSIGSIKIRDLYPKLQGMKLMTLQNLLSLMENPKLIPEEWKKGFDRKAGKFNRIFFFGDMPEWGWDHEWFQQVPYLWWSESHWPSSPHWNYDWELFCNALYSTEKRDDCVAVHGSMLSNYVSRKLYRIAQIPGKIRESEERDEKKREENESIYHKVCTKLGPFWMP